MKKEKTVKTYQRRTKTGKVVTVKQHTAKYDAAEALKEAAKKKGAGDELESLKKKPQTKPAKEVDPKDDATGFTAEEFKAWYHWDQDADPKNAAAKKVEKALKAKMGAKGYKKYFDEMTDSYSSRGHNKAFKGLGDTLSTSASTKSVNSAKETKASGGSKSSTAFADDFDGNGDFFGGRKASNIRKAGVKVKFDGEDHYAHKGKLYLDSEDGMIEVSSKIGSKSIQKRIDAALEASKKSSKEDKRVRASIEGLKDPKRDAAIKEMKRKDREYLKGVAKKAMFKNDPWFKRNGWTKQEKRNGNYSWISPDGNVSVPVTKLGMGAGKNFGKPKIKRSKE